jgi:hypothetical protein
MRWVFDDALLPALAAAALIWWLTVTVSNAPSTLMGLVVVALLLTFQSKRR